MQAYFIDEIMLNPGEQKVRNTLTAVVKYMSDKSSEIIC